MYRSALFRGAGLSLMLAMSVTPAIAGKADRARQSISEARAKIDAANKVGAASAAPELQAQAAAALRSAEENLARGNKTSAIEDAHDASQYADNALGLAQRSQAASASADVNAAQSAAISAQQDAAAASARADNAERAAASANAQAAAARAASAQPVTTMTTVERVERPVVRSSTVKSKPTTAKRTIRSTAPAPRTVSETTTTVTTAPAPLP